MEDKKPIDLREELEELFNLNEDEGEAITEELIEEFTDGRGDDDE